MMSEGIFDCDSRRCGDATDISLIEARVATRHPLMHRTAPHNKELSKAIDTGL